jgi:hypothetical protein
LTREECVWVTGVRPPDRGPQQNDIEAGPVTAQRKRQPSPLAPTSSRFSFVSNVFIHDTLSSEKECLLGCGGVGPVVDLKDRVQELELELMRRELVSSAVAKGDETSESWAVVSLARLAKGIGSEVTAIDAQNMRAARRSLEQCCASPKVFNRGCGPGRFTQLDRR